MTTPEADFGETLRRALAAVDHVDPAEDALDRIRRRTRLRTPRQGLDAALAVLIPWPLFRAIGYRTQLADLLGAGWMLASGRVAGFAGRSALLAGRAAALADDLTQRGYERAIVPLVRRLAPAARRAVAEADLVIERGLGYARRGLDRVAPMARRLSGPVTRRASLAWQQIGTPQPALPRPALPRPLLARHADQGAPRGRFGWMRPTLTAASVAFAATLLLTPTVRQAIVRLGSTVIPSGQNPGNSSANTLTGGAKHAIKGGQPHGGVILPGGNPGPLPPAGGAASPAPCPTPTQSPAGLPVPASPSSCATSTPFVTSSPTTAPSPSVSPTPTPSPSATVTPSPTPSPSATPTTDSSTGPPVHSFGTP